MSATESPAEFRARLGQMAHRAEVDLVVGDGVPVWQINPWDALPAHARSVYGAIGVAITTQVLRDVIDILSLEFESDAVIAFAAERGIDLVAPETTS